jgi:putative FmdB family regulatory protein
LPTYQYRCTECDHAFEEFQSFTDDALTVCPVCGGKLRKVFNAVGVVFKGSGFYRNDSRKSDSAGSSGSAGSDTGSSAKDTSSSSGSTTKDSSGSNTTSSTSSTSGSKSSSGSSSSPSGSSSTS